jgi:hypothetical protein
MTVSFRVVDARTMIALLRTVDYLRGNGTKLRRRAMVRAWPRQQSALAIICANGGGAAA